MKKLVVGVSGGPDSMAVLDMLRIAGHQLIVAHVNYHKRDSADRDQAIVESYCKQYQIDCAILDYKKQKKGNFQALARQARYRFFKELIQKYQSQAVVIAHHQDDHLETYLLQKKRGSEPSYYGLREVSNVESVEVWRPYLHLCKDQLLDYCKTNNIPYGLDESNDSMRYSRNRIRLEVQTLNEDQRKQLLKEIEILNQDKQKQETKLAQLYKSIFDSFDQNAYKNQEEKLRLLLVRRWLRGQGYYYETSPQCRQLDLALCHKESFSLSGQTYLICEQGLIKALPVSVYTYVLSDIKYFVTDCFELAGQGTSLEAVCVTEEDFPLVIRNWQPGDKIDLRFGTKAVSRFFVDRKIRKDQRANWPVLVNCQNKIILVPGLGCDLSHYGVKPSFYLSANPLTATGANLIVKNVKYLGG